MQKAWRKLRSTAHLLLWRVYHRRSGSADGQQNRWAADGAPAPSPSGDAEGRGLIGMMGVACCARGVAWRPRLPQRHLVGDKMAAALSRWRPRGARADMASGARHAATRHDTYRLRQPAEGLQLAQQLLHGLLQRCHLRREEHRRPHSCQPGGPVGGRPPASRARWEGAGFILHLFYSSHWAWVSKSDL